MRLRSSLIPLPPPLLLINILNVNRDRIERDTEIEFFKGSGPGGQHRNKRETGVRLRHVPTGIVIQTDERRSQSGNREIAFQRLMDAIKERDKPKKIRKPTKPPRSATERRLHDKHENSEKKKLRHPPDIK